MRPRSRLDHGRKARSSVRTTDLNGGAGIFHLGTLLTMTDCTVADNHIVADGPDVALGAIVNAGASRLEMTRCTDRDNSVSNAHAGDTGGGSGVNGEGCGVAPA